MMIRIQLKVACVCVLAVLTFNARPAVAQGTAFTYQGLLTNGALPANGLHDFRFRLFDAAEGGSQLGGTVCFESVVVVNGVFNVLLDFGDQFVTTGTRHLEIHVRQEIGQPCTDDFGYVLLAPRQRLTPAPQAIHANHTNLAILANHASLADAAFALAAPDGSPADAVVVDNDGNVGIGTTTPAYKLDVRGGPILVQNSGDQAELLWFESDRSWVFKQEGGGAGTALKLQSISGGGNKSFIIQTDGFVGINTTSPQAKLDVRGDIRLGATGEFLAPGGEENLRIIRGAIGPNGSKFRGSGFTSQRNNVGFYGVTFNTPFADPPVITATAINNSVLVYIFTYNATSASFFTINTASGSAVDNEFHFMAIGPR